MERAKYLAAARTYRRPLVLFTAVPVAIWIVSAVTAVGITQQLKDFPGGPSAKTGEAFQTARTAEHGMWIGTIGISSAMLLTWVGAMLSVHLKDVLGNPSSRLIPGLQRAHLMLAVLLTAIFTVVAPLIVANCFDLDLSSATVVALCLALFTVSAFIVHWFPFALPPVLAFSLLVIVLTSDRHGPSWSLSPTTNWAMIIASLGGLTCVGLRLAHFHEEMFEYHRRWQTRPVDARGFPWFFLSENMRLGRRANRPVADTLLGRALRWHAAWQTIWVAMGLGLLMGGILGSMALMKRFSIPEFVGSPNVAYLAIFPVITLVGQSRRYLIEELVRPPSRRDHVCAVGLAMATAVLVAWLVIESVGVLVILIWGRSGRAAAGLWESAAFSLCCLPVLFGAAVWPYRTSFVFMAYFAMFGVMGSFALAPLKLSGFELVCASASLLFVGLVVTRASYLRWLNHEVAPGPPLFGWREFDTGLEHRLALRKRGSRW